MVVENHAVEMKDRAAETPADNEAEQEGPFSNNESEKPKKKKVSFSTSEPEHMSQKLLSRQQSMKQEVESLAKPNWLTNWYVRCPCLCIFIGFLIMIIISLISSAAGLMEPSKDSDRGYFVWGDPYVNNFDKTELAL